MGKYEVSKRARPDAHNTNVQPRGLLPRPALLVFLWFVVVYEELMLRLFTMDAGIGKEFLLPMLFALTPALLVYALCRCFGRKGNFAVALVFTLLISVLFISQLVYFEVFQKYYIAYSMTRAGQVADMGSVTGPAIGRRLWQILIMLIPFLVQAIGGWWLFDFSRVPKARRVLLPVLLLFWAMILLVVEQRSWYVLTAIVAAVLLVATLFAGRILLCKRIRYSRDAILLTLILSVGQLLQENQRGLCIALSLVLLALGLLSLLVKRSAALQRIPLLCKCFVSLWRSRRGLLTGAALVLAQSVFSWKSSTMLVLLWLVLAIVLVWSMVNTGKPFAKGIRRWRAGLVLGLLMVGVEMLTVALIPAFGAGDNSPYQHYYNINEIDRAAPELGMLTAFRLSAQRLFFGFEGDSLHFDPVQPVIPTSPTEPPEASGTPADPSATDPDASGPSEPTEPQPTEPQYNVLNLDWDAIIAGESNDILRETDQYFASLTPSMKNDKTGMFQGCNLIMLTCEAFSYLAIDPELTPTLYKLQTEGFYFTNFYTPGWGVSTSDGEYVALTGTIPTSGTWSMRDTASNSMPLVMGNQLKSLGYECRAYHNHTYTYYDRDQSHPNLGYVYKALGNGLDVKETWPESDLEMMELTCDEYMGSEPFHTYYMTVSGHGGYSFSGNYMSWKNRELVADLPYGETARAYLAAQIELDRAMEYLLNKLEEYGIAENTVIVMTADHYPYGMDNNGEHDAINELLGHEVETNFELYRNACIIYKKGMTPETIDEPCCSMDLLPTLSNLFGLEFDSRLYMGRDVFSDAPPLVIFANRSWITDQCMYNARTGEITNLTDTEVTEEYVAAIKNSVSNKFIVSQRILEYDYWRVLFG